MQGFKGFPPGKTRSTSIPNLFFSDLLPGIDHLPELKLTLYCFWVLQQQEGEARYVSRREILQDKLFLSGLADDPKVAEERLTDALERATSRGTLLHVSTRDSAEPEDLYFMNTTRGRNAVRAIEEGRLQIGQRTTPISLMVERPNIFTLYEQNIGPLTPLIVDELRDAERTYPDSWIQEAIGLSVTSNKRSWRYVLTILKRWQNEGKDSGAARQASETDRYKYIEGELSDFIDY